MAVKIVSTGSFLGTNVVNNKDLFARINNFDSARAKETVKKKGNDVEGIKDDELFDIWVRQVSGVEQRVFFDASQRTDSSGPTQLTEYMGYMAALDAMKRADVKACDIDHIIFCSYTPEQLMPNPACLLAHYIGAEDISAFHMNTACSSFLDGIGIAYMMIKSKEYKRILVVGADLMSKHMDFNDITTAILFGDGASAVILEESDIENEGILSFYSTTSYNNEMLSMNYGEPILMKGGPLVQRNAVNSMYNSLQKAMEKAGKKVEDIDYLLPHQANLRILQRLADKSKISYDKTLLTVVKTGNVSGAALGIGMDLAFKGEISNIQFKKGDLLGFTTVGGGYTCAGMAYQI